MREINEWKALRGYVETFGTQREAARAMGLTEPALSQMLQRHRRVSDSVLRRLGLKRAVIERVSQWRPALRRIRR